MKTATEESKAAPKESVTNEQPGVVEPSLIDDPDYEFDLDGYPPVKSPDMPDGGGF